MEGVFHLQRLEVEGVRALGGVRLLPHPGMNVVVGGNGAGKTSLLEAIHLLGTGRSFRTRDIQPLVGWGGDELRVFGEVARGEESWRLGLSRRAEGGATFRVNGRAEGTLSAVARRLPLAVFSPERQQLLSGASEYRRGLMDWALFHVEPSYGEALQRYRRALRQRNVALRQRAAAEQVRAWDGELAEWGTGVDEARAAYVDDLRVALAKVLVERAGGAVEVGYRRGWASGHSLAQALTVGLERDRTQGWTGAGPHLADLLISVGGRPARVVASRGQGRVIVASLVLAHVLLLRARTGHSPVVLADDVASELDGAGRAWFVEELAGLPSQVFVTAVEKELLPITRLQSEHKVFHVERGRITELL